MAYDQSPYRRDGEQLSAGPAAYRAGAAATDFRTRGYDPEPADSGVRITEPLPEPIRRHNGDAGDRDRLGVHIGWEIVLLLAVAAIAFLLYQLDADALRRPALDTLLISGAAIGLLGLGAGLSLCAGVPNLAVGPISLAAALHFAENGDQGLVRAAVPALIVAAAGGLIAAIVVLVFHVPGWLTSLGAAMGVIVYDQLRTAPAAIQGTFDPSDQAFFLFGGFALLAVLGGASGASWPVRRMVGRMRPTGDPAVRPGGRAVFPVLTALVVSSVFAVVAGILFTAGSDAPVVPGTGLEWTGIAFGVALLAGTSAYGRRGGIFGTLLATAGITLFLDYAARRDLDIALFAVGAVTIGAGLVVTRLVEAYGKPAADDWTGGEDWSPAEPNSWGNGR
ncbi:ABC transporter permease [Actinoplanes sp. NPDC051859]|uniref:ABC transporter permease n=1 Tax=Actinoplanes sp. NPDC051859 TaxID=3363909 RepID=UPI0037B2C7F7